MSVCRFFPYIALVALLGCLAVVFSLTLVFTIPLALVLGFGCCAFPKNEFVKGGHIVITGGSSGIGLAIAKRCAAEGAKHITLVARNVQKLEAAKQELEAAAALCSVSVCSLDLSAANEEEIRGALLQCVPQGRVDLTVLLAGDSGQPESFENISAASWESMLRLNVLGCAKVTQAVLPAMKAQNSGHICFIGSMAGQAGIYGYSGYSASKFGLRGFVEVLRMELADREVSVSLCCPPDTETPMFERENETKPLVTKEISKGAGIWSAQKVAEGTLNGIRKGKFVIGFGLDGFMLNIVTAGFGPASSPLDLVLEVTLLPLARLIAVVYLSSYDAIVRKHSDRNHESKTSPLVERAA